MTRKIIYYGNPLLRQKARSIGEITPGILALAQDLIDLMVMRRGVGLAATQVGEMHRIFVARDEILTSHGEYQFGSSEVFLNLDISAPSIETQIDPEGCLSIPGVYANVERPLRIHVRYQTLEGKWVEKDLEKFMARVVMHENDHLNGVLFIDRISKEDRKRFESNLRAIKQKHN